MTLVVSLVSLLAPAFATESDETVPTVPNARYAAVTDLVFDGVALEGTLVRPENLLVLERRRATFHPLVRLRADFDAEMSESVDDVR